MSVNQLAVKSPVAVLTWTFNFASEVPVGETVASIVTTVPSGVTKDAETPDLANSRSNVRISGGTHGKTYLVRSLATLSNSEKVEGFLTLKVMDGAG